MRGSCASSLGQQPARREMHFGWFGGTRRDLREQNFEGVEIEAVADGCAEARAERARLACNVAGEHHVVACTGEQRDSCAAKCDPPELLRLDTEGGMLPNGADANAAGLGTLLVFKLDDAGNSRHVARFQSTAEKLAVITLVRLVLGHLEQEIAPNVPAFRI